MDKEYISKLTDINSENIPKHIAIIMDGNGRWATNRGLRRTEGHRKGVDAFLEAVEGCIEVGVSYLTVYAFSTENWGRDPEEVSFLMNHPIEEMIDKFNEFKERGIRVRFIGRSDSRIPKKTLDEMIRIEKETIDNSKLTIIIAFNYGGRTEIVDAARSIVAKGLSEKEITEQSFSSHLYIPEIPSPDLVIRTSGEMRISNFIIWQLAYAELLFIKTLWPDITRKHIFGAIVEYQERNRRFGKMS